MYAEWCDPCKLMDKTTFVNDTVLTLLHNNFIATRINIDDEKIGVKSNLSHILLQLEWEGTPMIMTKDMGWCFHNAGAKPRSIEQADVAIEDLKHATHIKWYTWKETDQTHLQPEKAKTTSSTTTKESVPTQQPVTVKQTHLNCENEAAQKN